MNMFEGTLVVLVLLLATWSASASAVTLICTYDHKFQCSPDGCGPVPSKVFSKLDIEAQRYSRCDSAGCDDYDATISQSGAFVVLELPGHGMFAKISDERKATEVVSLGNAVLVSFGQCHPE
jgi:hypothetical protein